MARRLAAIFAADVVGYSKLMAEDEAGTLAALKAHRRDLFDPETERHGGRIVKLMGDGALVEFPSVVDAVECAISVQTALAASDRKIRLRIGINLGDVIIDGEDIYGDGVNVASRLEALAKPGGICISSIVHESLGNRVDASFADAGEHEVKNIARPIRVFRWAAGQPEPAGATGTKGSEKPSIAVLPFNNMSGDPDQDFLADGISEDLITALSKVRWFFVIARNSTFTYKGRAVDVTQVARELGVRYVLEGSVRRARERVRVTAQLIDAASSRHVWAERYDREIEDIFDLQDEMTRTIVGAVEPELSAAERDRALSKPPGSMDAWESYQRGVWHMWKYQRDHWAPSQDYLKRATELDPTFAPAFAYWAYVHYQNVIMGWSQDVPDSLCKGAALAQKALALDNKDAVAYFAAGRIYMMQGRHDDSIAALETAIDLNPSFAQAFHGLGMALTLAGELDRAKEALLQAERLSPRDPILWASTVVHGLACLLSDDREGAIHWARKTVQNPQATGYWPHAVLAAALAHAGQMEEARDEVAAAMRALPELSLSYLSRVLPVKQPGGLDIYLEALRKAGLPE